MAAKDFDSGAIKTQELDDMTTCCICTEVYTDPKVLPCIHTFCMKCLQETGLKTNKGPGDEMPCPICRRMFKIPPEGFRGLPKNFFIENLIQVSNISDQSASSRAVCDACLDENKEETGKEIPDADAYCVECKYKLCDECCNEHRKFRFTKNHNLIPVTEHEGGQSMMTDLAPNVCDLHEQKILDVYCSDCKTVVCAICFIEDHKNHEGSHVYKFVDDLRKQIESNAEAINECRSKAEIKKAELLKVKEDIQERVGTLECDVEERKYKLKQLSDKHASDLLQSLCTIRQRKLKEIQMATDDIDTCLLCLETYSSYCQKILDKGSASDICRAFSDLSVRAVELQEQSEPLIEGNIQSFNFCFRKSELEEFLKEICDNLFGEIEEDGDSKPKQRSKEVNLHKTTLRTLEDNVKKLKQELKMTKTDSRNKILNLTAKLKQEQIEKEQLMIVHTEEKRGLHDKLRYKSDPDFVRIIITKAAEVGKKPIHGLTILDKELFVVSGESSEVEVYDSIKLSFSRRWNLKELIGPRDIGSCNKNKCLYIIDCKVYGQSSEILRVDPNGNLIKNWLTGDDYLEGGLSVTDESNVILTVHNKNILNEYSPDGQLVRKIDLSLYAEIRQPWHAIKLSNGNFVVSHGFCRNASRGFQFRVCVVDADGKRKKSFGGFGIGQVNSPVYLSVDGNGFVMVVDQENSRVLLLDPDLQFKRVILPKEEKYGLQNPFRILLGESNGRVFVADNGFDSQKKTTIYRRILIFDFE